MFGAGSSVSPEDRERAESLMRKRALMKRESMVNADGLEHAEDEHVVSTPVQEVME